MKTCLSLWLLLGTAFTLNAQETGDYAWVDSKALNIPQAETYSSASIAKFIQANFTTDKDKLRAIYRWITDNIKYDTDSVYVLNFAKEPDAKITAALRRRRGVCENYAALFRDITAKCNIYCREIAGYTKQGGSVDKAGHTWCLVYLGSQWLFCDPTWDQGYRDQARYFLISPDRFIESHMPFDPLWQLLDQQISHSEFYSVGIYPGKNKPYINFADSVKNYENMSELQQLESAAFRIQQAGLANELVKTRLVWLQMEISIIYQEKDMILYNTAVKKLNNANDMLNDFTSYRNERFLPIRPDTEIRSMISPVDYIILSAHKSLAELDSSPGNFQYDTGLLKNRLITLSKRLQEQKDFLDRYFSTEITVRDGLFYR